MEVSKRFYVLAASQDPPPKPRVHGVVEWVQLISRLDEKRRQALYEALGGRGKVDGWTRRKETMRLLFELPPDEREKLWAVVSEWSQR